MRRIIDGRRYDTETADEVCHLYCRCTTNDFGWHDTRLYRTRRGAWFLAGHGYAASRWAKRTASGLMGPGDGIQPIDADRARSILEREDYSTDVIERFFDVEDA